MTVRTIGQRDKAARLSLGALAASLALITPATAQQADTPAPTPTPSSTFRLPPANDGRTPGVQGPTDNNIPPLGPRDRATPTPTPAPAPTPAPTPAPPVVATQPARPVSTPSAAAAPARRDASATTPPRQPQPASRPIDSAPVSPASANPADTPQPADDASATAAPGFSNDPTAPVAVAPPSDSGAAASPSGGAGGAPIWAWLLAGLAAVGAGVWYWRRRPAIAADAAADFDDPAAAPNPLPRPATPAPAAPRAASTPPPPAPPSVPARTAPPAASPLVTRPADEQRASVSMALDIRGIRMTSDQLIVAFALNLANQGPVAATGLMVRIALNQGSAMTEPVLARFFDGAGGSVLRDDMTLAPGAGEQLSTEVMLPRLAVEPLMVGGKPVLVPVMAFDVTYHWDGEGEAFGQNAGTFVLGREQGASGSEKLAPLPLDHPNFVVNRPAARTTAIRRVL
ncbi:MAG: hypothetical protein JNM03_18170 [Sphingopyxis sp.]|uniref:hypothetical protein n=1 Tax=Sphingopyxis sp. TaxID=1908224 RepID=UPI001A4E9D3B|nr:hypothetical protein [Sphingopyxis sp.]MBL9071913.1 hypothetical protein [Sphingopyxis sp.]